MAFRVFDAYGAASRPEATLRASGYLFISKGIMSRAGKESATRYQLRFDPDNGRCGIMLLDDRDTGFDEGVRRLNVEASGASLTLLPLLRYYGFPAVKEKKVLPVAFEDDLIIINLFDEFMKPADPKPARQPMSQPQRDEFDDDIAS
jgi:hypothetical protein